MLNHLQNETVAGLSTFATMAYIAVINAAILSDAGMEAGSVVVATIVVTAFSSLLMGLLANFPIAVAPGMGVSGYIAYSVVLNQGKSWEQSLGAVFVSGVLLLLLTILGARQKILKQIPPSLRYAITAGIGLFLVGIGLKHSDVLTHGPLTLKFAIALFGLAVIVILDRIKIRSAFILSIIVCWIIAIGFGLTHYKGLIALPPSITPTFLKLDLVSVFRPDFLPILFSIFLIALLDSSAALMTLLKQAGMEDAVHDKKRLQKALIPDALGSILGAMIGSCSLAIHLESMSGIKAGGKTGWTAIVVALCFLSTLFLYPVVMTIPEFASAGVLIFLGFLMFSEIKEVNWIEWTDWVPSLLIVATMPLTMSIFKGLSVGFISYSTLKLASSKWKEIPNAVWILSGLFLIHEVIQVA